MEFLYETQTCRYSWYDDAHTIVLFEIIDKWTWQDAYEGVKRLNQTHFETPHDTYTIFHFHGKGIMLPKGASGIPTLKYLMTLNPPNEKLIVVVSQNAMIEMFLQSISKAYGLAKINMKYRYAKSMEAAVQLIQAYCAAHPSA
ncbi:MAG: hypothetical protein J0M33_07115 [Anaerolineae bacterium]|nr:hypothetical protein [Anaerolineae bacterium]